MNVLSLFDGISCGQLALARAGHGVARYYSAEIDSHAINITRENFPGTTFLGDVANVTAETLPAIDLLLAGSPCQGFSNNGTKLGFEHKESKLFWHFVRILKETKPKYFLLENVSMKQEWLDIISREVGVQPICINSQLVSAQTRKRYYWTNILNLRQPADRGLTIFDILEKPIVAGQATITNANEAYTGLAPLGVDVRIPKVRPELLTKMIGRSNQGRFCSRDRVYATDGKSPCLNTVEPPTVGERVLSQEAPLPNSGKKLDGLCVIDKEHWRMLTPVECERLQTVPDNYTACAPPRHRYRALGNGWTVDVIAHVLANLV
jgi:DNA (cytosine-5)-methyltransferase 3A